MDWFQTGKEVSQGCILSLCLFNLHAEHIMRNAGLDEAQAARKAMTNLDSILKSRDITLPTKVCMTKVMAFSVSSFTFIKRLFSSSSLSAIRVVSSAYLRLLIFLPAILIPDCPSSNPALHMMYSAYKLYKQGDNIQPWHTPFPIWNHSVVSCRVLTVASWPVYKFLRRQVRWSGIPIFFRIFHNLLWSTQSKA